MNSNSLADIHQHMSANGIPCDQAIQFDGCIHRFSRDDKRKQRNDHSDLKSIRQNSLPAEEVKNIELLTETFGPPIILDSYGEPEGINQLFFSNRYACETRILYESIEKSFYEYRAETGLWTFKSDECVKVSIGYFFLRFIYLLGYKELLSYRTDNLLRQLLNLLKGSVEQTDIFHTKRGVIHVGNGILHLKENPDQLHPFSPDYYSRNRSEILLDPAAECPKFMSILIHSAITEEDSKLLQKYCGQCLLGYNVSQTILLISGTPGGGKSTLVSLIEKIIGLHNVAQLKVGLLSERFEGASFVGKTLLTGKDVPGNFLNLKTKYPTSCSKFIVGVVAMTSSATEKVNGVLCMSHSEKWRLHDNTKSRTVLTT